MARLARKSLFWFFADSIKYSLGLVTLIVVARFMGPEPLGMIGVATGFVTLFSFIPALGLETAHQKLYSDVETDKRQALGSYITLKLLLIFIYLLIIIGLLSVSDFMGKSIFTGTQLTLVYLVLLSRLLFHISKIQRSTFIASEKPAKTQVSDLSNKITLDLIQVMVALLGYGVIALTSAYVIGELVGAVVCLLMFRNYPFSRPSRYYLKKYLSFGIPLFAVTMLSSLNNGIDRLLIFSFRGVAEVGYYEISLKLTFIFVLLRSAISPIVFPTISRYHSDNDLARIQIISNKSERYLALIGTPLLVFLLVYTSELIELLVGDAFLPVVSIFRVLLILYYLNMVSVAYIIQLAATGYVLLVGKMGASVTLLNIILSVFLIPSEFLGIKLFGMGALGAAIATFVSGFAGMIYCRYSSYRLNNVKGYSGLYVIILAGVISGWLTHTLSAFYSLTGTFWLIVDFSAILIIYIGILAILREINQKDLSMVKDLINIKEMKVYLFEEIKE